jgi:hypothetical protein
MTRPGPVEAGIARSEPSGNRTRPAPASMCQIACSYPRSSSRTSAVTARPARFSPRMVAREPSNRTPTGLIELSHGTDRVTVQSQGGPHPATRSRMKARESDSRPALCRAEVSMAHDLDWLPTPCRRAVIAGSRTISLSGPARRSRASILPRAAVASQIR